MEVIVSENRQITLKGIGQIVGENNATVLEFSFPEKIVGIGINEFNKYIVFDIEGSSPQLITDNKFDLSNLYTKQTELVMQIFIKRGNAVLFKSDKFLLEFSESIETSYSITIDDIDIIDNLITQYQELVKETKSTNQEITTLKENIEQAEESRDEAESERNENEVNRVTAELEREQKAENLINKLNSIEFSINKSGILEVKI